MPMTTNKSPLREKLGNPEGEGEEKEKPEKYEKQEEIERTNDNSPTINEADLSGDKTYIVNIKKSSDKRDKEKE